MMKIDYEDFTIQNYIEILDIAKETYDFVFFNELKNNNREKPIILWRHDVDISCHRALELANLEYDRGIKSTYFILLHSPFYNIFEKDIASIILQINEMGHQIGLHFDIGFYNVLSKEELALKVKHEKNIIEDIIDEPLYSLSLHNPNPDTLNYDNYTIEEISQLYPQYFSNEISGLINTYGKFFRDIPYISDSNGYWRFDYLKDVLQLQKNYYDRLHVLLHPEWWVPETMSPRNRVLRAIEGRAKSAILNYDLLLEKCGRKNVK